MYKYPGSVFLRSLLLRQSSPLLHICLPHLDPNPTLRAKRNVRFDPNLLVRLPAVSRRPCYRRLRFRVRIHVQRDRLECLCEPHYDGGSLVISELLAEAVTGAGVEGKENEGVRNEVRLDPIIEEAFRVVFERWGTGTG